MESRYNALMDDLCLPAQRVQAIRAELSLRCNQANEEATVMKTRKIPKPAIILAAALLVAALSVTALAASGVLGNFHLYLGNGSITRTEDSVSVSVNTDAPNTLYEIRDGRVYLTVDGHDDDITDLFDYETPYIYEFTDESGIRHTVIIGGDLDAIGSAEFLWDTEGQPAGGASSFGTPEGADDAPWFDAATEQLGLPW